MYMPDHEYELLVAGIREIKEKSLSNLRLAEQASQEMAKLKAKNLQLTNEMLDLQIRYNDLCVASMDVIGDHAELELAYQRVCDQNLALWTKVNEPNYFEKILKEYEE